MRALTRLEDYLENAPMKTKIAIAAAGTLMAALVATQTLPSAAHASELHPQRTAPIVQHTGTTAASDLVGRDRNIDPVRMAPIVQHSSTPYKSDEKDRALAIERLRPLPATTVSDIGTVNKLNERTRDMLRDANEIATRFHESKAWTGDMFTPEQKAKNIAQAFMLAQMRADHPEEKKLDGYVLKLREDIPENRVVNNIIADVNFKRETLRNATLELGALVEAMKDNRLEDVEKHRFMMETLLKDASYAMNDSTDWSMKAGRELDR
jgi:hypothetical protein